MKIKIFSLFSLLYFLLHIPLVAQTELPTLLVNEIGIAPQSQQRYIELLVLGEVDVPIGQAVDLSDWSIDNLSMENPADIGFITLGSTFSSMYPGTLILIYDEQNPHPDIDPAADGLPNANGIYQLSLSSPHLEKQFFNAFDTANGDFSWDKSLDFNSNADVLVLRDANQTLQHAISWAGADYEEADHLPVINIATALNPAINTVSLNNPCSILSEGFRSGSDHQLGPSMTPGRYNSMANGLWINNLTTSGLASVTLDISCQEQSPAGVDGTLGSISVQINGGMRPFTVSWSGPESGSITVSTMGNHTLPNLPAGTYQIVVTDSRECQSSCHSTVSIFEESDPLCKGACQEIGVETTEGECYSWYPADDLQEPHPSMWMPCPEEITTYLLIITNEEGELIQEIFYKVEIVNLEVNISPDPIIQCGGESLTLDAGAFPFPVTYAWSSGETTQTIDKSNLGEYSVIVTNTEHGCSASDVAEIIAPDDCEGIASWFEDNNFKSVTVSAYEPSVFRSGETTDRSSSACLVNDYADLVVTIENVDYDLEEVMCQGIQLPDFDVNVYITSSSAENMCGDNGVDSNFDRVKETWETMPQEIMVWAHVCLNADGTATLYWSQRLKEEEVEVTDDCEQQLLNAISNEWIRKAFANGKGKKHNNIKICDWHKAIKEKRAGTFYRVALGRIGEGLVAEKLYNSFNDHGLFEIASIHLVPGGNNILRLDPLNRHIDIAAYFFMYRAGWPISPSDPGVSGIKIPVSDKETGVNDHADFRILNPNDPTPQIGWLEAVIEVKTFKNSNRTLSNINEGINEIHDGIGWSNVPGSIGLLVIPRERWAESSGNQSIIDAITNFEADNITLFSYPEEQQAGYFWLFDDLHKEANRALHAIQGNLANINCECSG